MLRSYSPKSGKSIVCLLGVVLLTLLLLGGIPVIWLSFKPVYTVAGAIRVVPSVSDTVTGEVNGGAISDHDRHVNTQAEIVSSRLIVQRAADALADKKLSFFQPEPYGLLAKLMGAKGTRRLDPAAKLRRAIVADKSIVIAPDRHSEQVKITMQNTEPQQARQIVDAFISAYTETNAEHIQGPESPAEPPARISVAYYADVVAIRDSRIKYTIGMVAAVVVCGMIFAILGKANRWSKTSAS